MMRACPAMVLMTMMVSCLGLVRGITERRDRVGRRARFQKRTDDVWMPVTTDR